MRPTRARASRTRTALGGATVAAACAAAMLAAGPATADATQCSARSGATVTPLVELYTSEGCSSCPPADRWLSQLKAQPGAVALAYHVSYWDYLGWRDRFGSTAFSQRQQQQRAVNGASNSYTPQVVIDGIDRPDWHRRSAPAAVAQARPRALVNIAVRGEGGRLEASIDSLDGAPQRLAGWWAVTEDGHASTVKAGENEGSTLQHDFVVRELRPVAAWAARPGQPVRLAFDLATPADPQHPRRVGLVITDATTGRPLQALQFGC
jgi:hypothetical protein